MSIIYQVDRSVTSSGKRVAVTKRRVRWQWGISNVHALATGATGAACRGSEHEVTLVWSIASGKRLVLFDGKEVTFSSGRRAEGKFECNWTAPNLGNYVLTIIAYAAAPLRDTPGFQQFDLIINGQSFSDMCRIYELGLREECITNHEQSVGAHTGYGEIINPPTRKEEWKWAEQVNKLEQDMGINEAGLIPPSRSHSLPIESQRNIDNVFLPRSNSVSYAHDLPSESSATVNNGNPFISPFPVHIDSHHTLGRIGLNWNQSPSYETIRSTIMDAYDFNSTNQKDAPCIMRTAENGLTRKNETSSNETNPAVVNHSIHQIQPENTRTDSGSMQNQNFGMHKHNGFLHVQTRNIENVNSNLEHGDTKCLSSEIVDKSPRTVSGIDDYSQNIDNIEKLNVVDVNPITHQFESENTQTDSESVQIQIDDIHSNNVFLHVHTGNTANESEYLEANTEGLHKQTVAKSPRGVSGIDEAMKNLVNIENILSPVFNTKLTMDRDHEKEFRDNKPITTQERQPTMGSQVQFGRQLTLLELKHQQSSKKITPLKEIMNSHHCAAEENNFAMVVYPQPQQHMNYSHSYPYISYRS